MLDLVAVIDDDCPMFAVEVPYNKFFTEVRDDIRYYKEHVARYKENWDYDDVIKLLEDNGYIIHRNISSVEF